jgi:hypothetical protein
MKALISILFFAPFIVSCSNDNIEKQIANEIETKCGKKECLIKIATLTTFDWDKMYVFTQAATLDDVDQALGFNYINYVELRRPIIFVKDNQIVNYENDYRDEEDTTNGQVLFRSVYGVTYKVFTPQQAIFKAQLKLYGKSVYYVLSEAPQPTVK